jgi:hypothetical protein
MGLARFWLDHSDWSTHRSNILIRSAVREHHLARVKFDVVSRSTLRSLGKASYSENGLSTNGFVDKSAATALPDRHAVVGTHDYATD